MKKNIIIALLAAILALTAYIAVRVSANGSEGNWTLVSDDTVATVYNAVPEQTNADYVHTACMYEIDLENISSLRVLAMERTMMARHGIAYGDIVLIEGAGRYNGYWRVLDTMNKRFKGQSRIDFLVPNHIKHGRWNNVKVYVPADKRTADKAESALSSTQKQI